MYHHLDNECHRLLTSFNWSKFSVSINPSVSTTLLTSWPMERLSNQMDEWMDSHLAFCNFRNKSALGAWVDLSVEHPTLGFSSDGDPGLWDRALYQAPCSVESAFAPHSTMCSLPRSLSNKWINKISYNKTILPLLYFQDLDFISLRLHWIRLCSYDSLLSCFINSL